MGIGIICCEKPREESKNPQLNSKPDIQVPEKPERGEKSTKPPSPKNKEYSNIIMESMSRHDFQNQITNPIGDSHNFTTFNIYIEKFEITYNKIDDFGLNFNPEILLKFNSIKEVRFQTFVQNVNEEHDNEISQLNISNMNDKSINENSILNRSEMGKSNINKSYSLGGKKIFYFNYKHSANLSDFDNWKNKSLRIKLYNKNKKSDFFPILVCSNSISFFDLLNIGESCGKIPLRNKLVKEIGLLYCRFNFGKDESPGINYNSKKGNNSTLSFNNESNLLENFTSPIETEEILYKLYTVGPYELLHKSLRDKFQIRKIDPLNNVTNDEKYLEVLNSKISQINKIRDIDEDTTFKRYAEIVFDSIVKGQHILTYGVISKLIIKLQEKNITFIDEFSKLIKRQKNEYNIHFFNLAEQAFKHENFSLSKVFYYFLYLLIEHYRSLELEQKKFCCSIDFEELCDIMIDNLGIFYQSLVTGNNQNSDPLININNNNKFSLKNFSYEQKEEIKETTYWILNCLFLLVSPNLSDEITDLNIINIIYTITFKNSVKILTKPKYMIDIFIIFQEDSDICGSVAKIIRKSLQLILDDANNYIQVKDRPKIISASIRELIIHDEKYQKFLVFIEICFTRFVHYPEIYSNILLILICLSHDHYNYPEIIRRILDFININDFCSRFDIYRGNIKKIGKNVNYFFYKFIFNLTTLNKSFEESETLVNIKKDELICFCDEITKLYRLKEDSNKKGSFIKGRLLSYFTKSKNVELHEVICCICGNLTKNTDACMFLCKEKFYLIGDLIDFFFQLNKDFLQVFLNKYKNQKKEKVPLIISIIDNTLLTFDNIITRNHNTRNFFLNILQHKSHTKNKVINHISELVDSSTTLLNFHNNKMKKTAENFINNFE